MRIVIAECTVDYAGRLHAHLPLATRLVMVKADGCVAVHADGGAYKPLTGTDVARPILCNHLLAAARIDAPVFSTRFACDLPRGLCAWPLRGHGSRLRLASEASALVGL